MTNVSGALGHIVMPSIDEPILEDILAVGEEDDLLYKKLENAKLNRFEVDTKLRIHLTYIFSAVIFLWLTSVISVLFFNHNCLTLNLSDQVLMVLLTTTSVNVIGMMLIILKNLFPKNGH